MDTTYSRTMTIQLLRSIITEAESLHFTVSAVALRVVVFSNLGIDLDTLVALSGCYGHTVVFVC